MEKLNLPIIKGPMPPPPILSMNQYFDFVQMFLKYFFDRKSYEYWKEKRTVNVPFSLK